MRYLFALLVFTSLANADCTIVRKDQVRNVKPGCCMWASLETICNHLHIRDGRGVRDYYLSFSHPDIPESCAANSKAVESQLKEWSVKYAFRSGDYLDLLRQTSAKGLPALIAFREESALGRHACIMTSVDDKYVYFIDSNHVGALFRYTIADFIEYSAGWCLVIYP